MVKSFIAFRGLLMILVYFLVIYYFLARYVQSLESLFRQVHKFTCQTFVIEVSKVTSGRYECLVNRQLRSSPIERGLMWRVIGTRVTFSVTQSHALTTEEGSLS